MVELMENTKYLIILNIKLGNEIKVLRKTTSSSSKKNNKAEMQPF